MEDIFWQTVGKPSRTVEDSNRESLPAEDGRQKAHPMIPVGNNLKLQLEDSQEVLQLSFGRILKCGSL